MIALPNKKYCSLFIAYCFIAVPLVLASCTQADSPAESADCKLRVAWDPYEPYSYSDGGDDPIGFDIEVVTKVADDLHCSLEFTEMPWSDILIALEDGTTDITIGTGYKPDRSEWSWYSESYRDEVIGLLMREGAAKKFPGESLNALFARGMVLGKTTDDTYDVATEALFARYPTQLRERVSEEDNLTRLLNGAVDAFLVEVNVAAAIARKQEVADRVEFHSLAFPAGAYRLQMSKKTVSPERLADINASLQRLVASGWTARTLQTYAIH